MVKSVAGHIVTAIGNSVQVEKPWKYRVLSNVLPPMLFSDLVEASHNWMPNVRPPDASPLRRRTVWMLNAFTEYPWETVRTALSSASVVEAFNRVTGTSGGIAVPRVNVDGEGYRIGVHADTARKVGTFTINLCTAPKPEYGLWIHDGRRTVVLQLPFEPNGGYLFRRTTSSMHSVKRVTGTRRTLMVPIFFENLYRQEKI